MQLKSYKKQPKIGFSQLSYMIKSFQKEGKIMNFSEKLVKLRKENKMSQEDLAASLDV